MRVFVTGAAGWIGSAVVPELLEAGHQVVGLARSEDSAAALTKAGAEVQRGTLDDLDILRSAAAESDGVIASGTLGLRPGQLATERDGHGGPAANPLMAGAETRRGSAELTLSFADRGVRSSVLRLPPTVHGDGDNGFMATIVGIARAKGLSGYLGDGSNRWPAAHRLDVGRLFRLALENAPAGSTLHAIDDEGVPIREIAEVIGRHLDVPVAAISAADAAEHFTWLAGFLGIDSPASSTLTRELLGWQPTHQGLLADLDEGHYFRSPPA